MNTTIQIPEQPLDAKGHTTLEVCIFLAVLPFTDTLTVRVDRGKAADYIQAVRMQMSRARNKARKQTPTGALLYEFVLRSHYVAEGNAEYVTFKKEQTLTHAMETAVKKRMLANQLTSTGDK